MLDVCRWGFDCHNTNSKMHERRLRPVDNMGSLAITNNFVARLQKPLGYVVAMPCLYASRG
jgi:hypothetical protein